MSFGNQDPEANNCGKKKRCNTWPGIKKEPLQGAKPARLNLWGSHSYADLITYAISSSPQQRLTLTQIYDWIIENIPYFRHKSDKASSAGWKNSIRHNLSLHSKFMKVQNEVAGKSSWWMINHHVKDKPDTNCVMKHGPEWEEWGALRRKRCVTMDTAKVERKGRKKMKKIQEESVTDFSSSWFQNNARPQMMEVQTYVQSSPSTSYEGNTSTNIQADQNFNHMVATFQCGMTLYYPSPPVSHTNSCSMYGVPFMNNAVVPAPNPELVQFQNTTNLDDLDLNPIRLPYEIDIEGIIRRELEIDGCLDFT